jgi:hypothetical protein
VKLPPPGPLPCGPCFGCGREIEVVIRKGRPECGAAVGWLPDMVLTPRLPRPLRASRHRLGSRAAGRGASHWRADGSRIVIRGPVCSRRGSCRRALRRYVSRGRGQGPRRGPCGRGPSGKRVRHAVVVVFHSIVCQYRRRKERQAVRQTLDAAGLHARRDTALAWLRLEPDDEHPGRAALRLTLWPGGHDELLARKRLPRKTRRVARLSTSSQTWAPGEHQTLACHDLRRLDDARPGS